MADFPKELIPPGSRLREAEELLRAAPDLVADPDLRTFIETSLDHAARIDREAEGRCAATLSGSPSSRRSRRRPATVTGMLLALEAFERALSFA